MLGQENLVTYYRNNFIMAQHYKYSLTELENMLPYEREIYISMLNDHIAKENAERTKRQRS